MTNKILVLPGDGIGHEIVAEAVKVLDHLQKEHGLNAEIENRDGLNSWLRWFSYCFYPSRSLSITFCSMPSS